jgi:hypothetical protein
MPAARKQAPHVQPARKQAPSQAGSSRQHQTARKMAPSATKAARKAAVHGAFRKSTSGRAPRNQLATKAARKSAPCVAEVVPEDEEDEDEEDGEEGDEAEESDDDDMSFVELFEAAAGTVASPGAFAAGGEVAMPQPLISVEGVEDPLAWPLPGAQARELVEVAKRSSAAGSVSSCSVPPRLLTWGNAPAWDKELQNVLAKALAALGVSSTTKAELSALQIRDGSCGAHKLSGDSATSGSGWATLEISLPALVSGPQHSNRRRRRSL